MVFTDQYQDINTKALYLDFTKYIEEEGQYLMIAYEAAMDMKLLTSSYSQALAHEDRWPVLSWTSEPKTGYGWCAAHRSQNIKISADEYRVHDLMFDSPALMQSSAE